MKIKQPAFTLIESMMVMVILALSLSGATYLMITVTNSIAENRQRIKATYLTQECMELTRNARDSAWRQNSEWHCSFGTPLVELSEFRISQDPTARIGSHVSDCTTDFNLKVESSSDFILKKRSDKLIDYSGTEGDLIYARKLIISDIKSGGTPSVQNAAKFTCEVTWTNRGNPQKVSMSQILTDWKK